MARPQLRPGVGAGIDSTGRLRIIFFNDGRHVVYEAHPAAVETVRALAHGAPADDIVTRVRATCPDYSSADFMEIVRALRAEGAIEDLDEAPALRRSDDSSVFRRQIDFMYDFAEPGLHPNDMHARVRDSAVAVIGVGGTGTWAAQSLALLGVGRLRLIDPDRVTASNLSRQVLFRPADVGRPKVLVAAEALRAGSPGGVRIEPLDQAISADSAAAAIAGMDLVINCADQPDINVTSGWVAQACMTDRTPHIVGGGYAGHTGLIGPTILPFSTACWTCFQIDARRRNGETRITPIIAARSRHTAAIAPLAAIVANLQVWDAFRVLSGLATPVLANRTGELNLTTAEISWHSVARDPECPMCTDEEVRG